MFNGSQPPSSSIGKAMVINGTGVDSRPVTEILELDIIDLIVEVVLGLDSWLDSMHVPGGYAGPVVHWFDNCLDYSEPGLDWRYEGIITGYLNLWHATSNPGWLIKAQQAGDDLVAGQFNSGNFRNSCFELNPNTGGTPHEAAASLGLLRLGLALRSLNDAAWTRYFQSAQKNITKYFIHHLWDPNLQVFYDGPSMPSISPDRLGTLVEVFFALSRLSGESFWVEKYALPLLDTVISHQVTRGDFIGAIHYRSSRGEMDGRFYPLFISRCMPAIYSGYLWTGDEIYLRTWLRSAEFLKKLYNKYRFFPLVLYENGQVNKWPILIAPSGDMLRALCQVQEPGFAFDPTLGLHRILAGRMENGAIQTAEGFGRNFVRSRRDDPRDMLPCAGWVDKSFRFLTSIVDAKRLEKKQLAEENSIN